MSAPIEQSTATPVAEAYPKPVTPAEAIPVPPAKALDPIAAEPSILDKAAAFAQPYLAKVEPYVGKATVVAGEYAEKASVVAGEYAEKAASKTEEFINKVEARIEGATTPTTATSTSTPAASGTLPAGVPTSRSLADAPEALSINPNAGSTTPPALDSASASTTAPSTATTSTQITEASEKAKVYLGQGLSAVQSTFDKLTHTIDEKTASPTHPGIITQVTNAVTKGVEKVEGYLNETAGTTSAGTTTTGEHPVQTTTNSLPHAPIGL